MSLAEDKKFCFEAPPIQDWEIDKQHGIYIHHSVTLKEGCKIGRNVVIHEGVIIEEDVEILDGVCIYPDTQIGRGSKILEYTNLGRPPEIAGSITRQLKEEYAPLVIGEGCLIGPFVKIYRGTEIGHHTSIYEFCTIREECQIGNGVVLAPGVTINYGTIVGDRVRVMHATHLTGGMVIENDVFISLHVSSTNDDMVERGDNKAQRWRGATIRRGAVIGAGVMLAPGIEVGEKSHVAMLSVVTKDIPPFSVAAGSPARVVRSTQVEK